MEQEEDRKQQDYRDFLEDIEEDPEMRQNINLYKVSYLTPISVC